MRLLPCSSMVNQQLLDYIRQQLAAGVSKEEIIQSLITTGWQGQDINDAFSTIGTQIAPQQMQQAPTTTFVQSTVGQNNSPHGKKKWPGILVTLAVPLLLGVTAAYAYFNFFNASTPPAQSQSSASTTPATVTAESTWDWTRRRVLNPSVTSGWLGFASSADGTHFVVDGSYGSDNSYTGDIFTSTDSGVTWTAHDVANKVFFDGIASSADGTRLAAIGLDIGSAYAAGSVYTSTDSGVTWTAHDVAKQVTFVGIASSADGIHLAAVEAVGGTYVYTSTDAGVTWTAHIVPGAGLPHLTSSANGVFLAIAAETNNTKTGGYIYTSSDSGTTWIQRTSAGQFVWTSITSSSDGTHLAATAMNVNHSGGYIYTSSDSGATWTAQTGAGQRRWSDIASSADGTRLAAVSADGDIYTSSDSGATWTAQTGAGQYLWTNITSSADGTRLAITEYGKSDVWTGVLTAASATTSGSSSVQKPLQNQTQTNQSNGPTISVNQTTATFGDTLIFTLHKNLQNAASWKFSFSCSTALAEMWNGSCNKQDTYYSDSQDTIILPIPVYGEVLQNETATAVFEAYDKSGNLLGQSTIPLIIEPNNSFLDREMNVDVASVNTQASLHYLSNNTNSYLGVCNDAGVAPFIKELKSISNSVVCKDSATAWAISAQLKSNPSQYVCSDPDNQSVVVSSAITTTSCQ